ncbi:tRNA 2-thiouridine synthesizing protein E [Kushneria sinocarnis]|uniref:Sulfurtransferase n=2 Tax=Kushneria sinocarnis TaxID=595502 RepID=A0A420WYC0_9GAMM|nr:tRNA 2-thiouridine synthesizing protein E [Kushneria sinocarnis]
MLDEEGYLLDPAEWTPAVTRILAEHEGRTLDERHWAIIELVRAFYERYEMAPAMRALVKLVRQSLGEEQGRSVYLMTLFPESPARVVARLAGLPKPTNCL